LSTPDSKNGFEPFTPDWEFRLENYANKQDKEEICRFKIVFVEYSKNWPKSAKSWENLLTFTENNIK